MVLCHLWHRTALEAPGGSAPDGFAPYSRSPDISGKFWVVLDGLQITLQVVPHGTRETSGWHRAVPDGSVRTAFNKTEEN